MNNIVFYMKSLAATLSVISIAMLPVSCNSYIEEDTSGLVTIESVDDSEQGCNYWVTGVYSKWVYDVFCWGYFPRVLEFDSDYISGPDWLFGSFGAGNFQAESDVIDALWKGGYGVIGRANTALRHVRAMKNISDAVRNNAIGELEFHKAMAYFLMVRAYGALPLVGEAENEEFNYDNPRQSVEVVYNEIFSLLKDAAGKMYKNTDSNYQAGHVSAGSAAGLLAKAYATAASSAMDGTSVVVRTGRAYNYDSYGAKSYNKPSNHTFNVTAVAGYEDMDATALYQEAKAWAAEVVTTDNYGHYELSDTTKLWKLQNRYASEFMFSVYVPNNDSKFKTAVHTQYAGYYTAPGSDFMQSGGWVGCTFNWYQLFDATDFRINSGVRHRWRNYTQEEKNEGFYYPDTEAYRKMAADHKGIYADGVNYYYSKDYQCLAFTTKYDDVTDNTIENADSPWPFLRLADVILIYAEAANETGDQTTAMNQLNAVRKRSGATQMTTPASRLDMRAQILEERAKELACEADRRWDLIRWGIYLDAMAAVGTDDGGILKQRSSRNLLYPLPAQEMNTNQALQGKQNPGWQ